MADREEARPDAADDLALAIWLDLPKEARTDEVLHRMTDTIRAALRTTGGGEPGRLETGVVQCGDDWPGAFIRGDEAMALGLALDRAIDDLPQGAEWFDLQSAIQYVTVYEMSHPGYLLRRIADAMESS